jgi:hypothetical protein
VFQYILGTLPVIPTGREVVGSYKRIAGQLQLITSQQFSSDLLFKFFAKSIWNKPCSILSSEEHISEQ